MRGDYTAPQACIKALGRRPANKSLAFNTHARRARLERLRAQASLDHAATLTLLATVVRTMSACNGGSRLGLGSRGFDHRCGCLVLSDAFRSARYCLFARYNLITFAMEGNPYLRQFANTNKRCSFPIQICELNSFTMELI